MKINRRQFLHRASLTGIVAALGIPATIASVPIAAQTKKPNILIILTDDSGYSDPGCYGGEIDTPNIDQLARNGMRFTNFYTAARCSPTRASLLTGRDSAHAGFGAGTLGGWNREMKLPAYRARLPYHLPTLPELLKDNGYQTMMAGKWHLGGSRMKESLASQKLWTRLHPGWELTKEEMEADYNALPAQRGFDNFFGLIEGETHFFFTPEDRHEYLEGNRHAKLNFDKTYSMHCYYKDENRYPFTGNHGKKAKAFYATDGVTDRAIEMLQEARKDRSRPFFMYLAYRAPHLPLQAPQELVDKYLPRYEDLESVEKQRIDGLVEEGLLEKDTRYRNSFVYRMFKSEQEKQDYQRRLAIHAAMLEKVDQNVGRIVDTLRQSGALEDTIILYFSDNGAASHVGDMMNKPYYGCKALLWEGGTRTHCIAHWPRQIEAGKINHTFCHVNDILPTCLSLAEGTYPAEFRGKKTEPLDGRDISLAFENEELPAPEYLFFNDKGQQGCIYLGKWKFLIEPGWYALTSKTDEVKYELYDIRNDPAEYRELSKSRPELVKKIIKRCQQWQKECGLVDYSEILKIRPDHTR